MGIWKHARDWSGVRLLPVRARERRSRYDALLESTEEKNRVPWMRLGRYDCTLVVMSRLYHFLTTDPE